MRSKEGETPETPETPGVSRLNSSPGKCMILEAESCQGPLIERGAVWQQIAFEGESWLLVKVNRKAAVAAGDL